MMHHNQNLNFCFKSNDLAVGSTNLHVAIKDASCCQGNVTASKIAEMVVMKKIVHVSSVIFMDRS